MMMINDKLIDYTYAPMCNNKEKQQSVVNLETKDLKKPNNKGRTQSAPLKTKAKKDSLNKEVKPDVIVMVGLPARGKSYMANKLSQYFNWLGIPSKVFNLGHYRRTRLSTVNSTFFLPDNEEAVKVREQIAEDGLNDLLAWIQSGGQVALFDATNTTKQRRSWIYKRTVKEHGYNLFYIESICTDANIVENNIKHVKIKGDDYKGVEPQVAYEDFEKRIRNYEKVYQPLKEEHLSYMQTYNMGKRFVIQNMTSDIQERAVKFLTNLKPTPHMVYLSRDGESIYNLLGRVGGYNPLSENGRIYAKKLGDYMKKYASENLTILTSSLRTSVETASKCIGTRRELRALDSYDTDRTGELDPDLRKTRKGQFDAFERRKFKVSYPDGESHEDLVQRLEPIILEIERTQNDFLIVTGRSVLTCLFSYFESPPTALKLHAVTSIEPKSHRPHSYTITTIHLGIGKKLDGDEDTTSNSLTWSSDSSMARVST